MPDYQVVLTPSGQDPILDNRLGSGGGGGAFPGFQMADGSVPTTGVTDAHDSLLTLISTIPVLGAGREQLVFKSGEVVRLDSSLSMPAHVRPVFLGGVVKPNSGAIVTLNHPIDAGEAQTFDESLGGHVVCGLPMTLKPQWWGADPTGATNSAPAVAKALYALTNNQPFTLGKGGKLKVPAGTYRMDDFGEYNGIGYSYIEIEGEGDATLFLSGTTRVSEDYRGIFSFYGGPAFGTKRLSFKSFRMSGTSTADATHMMAIDQAEEVDFTDITIENNSTEGIYSLGGEATLRHVRFLRCKSKNIGGSFSVGAFNLNALNVSFIDCRTEGGGVGFENMGHFTSILRYYCTGVTQFGVMLQSTYSGYLDPNNGYVQVNTFGGDIIGSTFSNAGARAIVFPDYLGHTNADPVHTTPSHIDGGLGKFRVIGNLFDRFSISVYGGADKYGIVELSGNTHSGQYDAGTGPQNNAINPMGGAWHIHDETFELGLGIKWVNLIGYQIGSRGAARRLVENCLVYNLCWNSVAFSLYGDDTIKGTKFIDVDGTIAGGPSTVMYQIKDSVNTLIAQLKVSEWAWWDPDHQISIYQQPTTLPLNSDTLPPFFSFKPGDRLVSRFKSASWTMKRCLTGGTNNPTALTATASATSGTKTMVVSSAAGLGVYSWISVPSIGGISNKQILGISGTTITVDTNFEAGVTAGTAIAWATATWATL